jgi:hypothetical protein
MPTTELVRSLTDDQDTEHPAGSIDEELDQILGAFDPADRAYCPITTFTASGRPCCY